MTADSRLSLPVRVARVVGLILRVTGCIAIWIAIVLAFGVLTALLPSLWHLVRPPGPETYDIGLVSLVAGFIGLFAGIWPAIAAVEWLVKRYGRRARERAPRSSKSVAS